MYWYHIGYPINLKKKPPWYPCMLEKAWNLSNSASTKSWCYHHHRGDCHFVLAVYVCGLVNVDATSHMSLSCRPDQWRLTALCTLHTACSKYSPPFKSNTAQVTRCKLPRCFLLASRVCRSQFPSRILFIQTVVHQILIVLKWIFPRQRWDNDIDLGVEEWDKFNESTDEKEDDGPVIFVCSTRSTELHILPARSAHISAWGSWSQFCSLLLMWKG